MHTSGWTVGLLTVNTVFLASLLFYGVKIKPVSPEPPKAQDLSSPAEGTQITPKMRKLFDEALEKHGIQQAHDLLMVAARRSPTDPVVVDMLERFVTAARASSDPMAEDLADDVVLRAESLIYVQPAENVAAFRARLDQLLKQEVSIDAPPLDARDDGLRALVAMANNKAVPLALRLQAAEQARGLLDDQLFASVLAASEAPNVPEVASIQAAVAGQRSEVDAAEMACLIDLVRSTEADVQAWQSEVTNSLTALQEKHLNAVSTPAAYLSQDEQLEALIGKGVMLLDRSAPLSRAFETAREAEVNELGTSANDLVRKLREQVANLTGRRVLLYNQHVLSNLQSLNPKDSTAVGTLVSLLDHEEWLMPFVEKRFSEAWDFALGQLSSDEERLQAMQSRVIRTLSSQR